eukprot:gene13531-16545_t
MDTISYWKAKADWMDDHMGTIRLDEGFYYPFALSYVIDTVDSASEGSNRFASTLYPRVFGEQQDNCSSVLLPSKCKPEFDIHVRDNGLPTQNGELKSIDKTMLEEQAVYGAICMAESYFPPNSEHNMWFYDMPPVSIQIVGWGPVGMLMACELVGSIFYSIISKPFFLASPEHEQAIAMVNNRL